jgi:predicted transposase/invertase (TIGR01784 family)
MPAQHDSHFKLLFSHRELVHDLLVEFVSVIRPDTLRLDTLERVSGSYISDRGKAREEDMVWKVRLAGGWLYVYLLLEFQSTSDTWMALRMHVYVGLLFQDLLRQKQIPRGHKLPPVLPIVLYNGDEKWQAATDLVDLLASVPQELQQFQPGGQRYLLIDQAAYPAESLDTRKNLVAALFRLERSRGPQDMERVLVSLSEWLAEPRFAQLRRDFSLFARWKLRREVDETTIPEAADLLEIRSMLEEKRLTWSQEWKREGKLEGIREGKLEGMREGKLEGIREGKLEGERGLLRRLLETRFGAPLPGWAEERLVNSTEEDLLRWGELMLRSTVSLEQVLT